MFKHILVPTDGSELSLQTAQRAISFAKEAGARITIFHARPEYLISYFGEGTLVDLATPEKFSEITSQQTEQYLGDIRKACAEAGVPCDTRSAASDMPYKSIIEAAESGGCDLIFMASHGRRGMAGLLMGSETQKVLTHTKIPVLVYR